MIKWDLPQGCKDSSTYAYQSVWYTTLTNWRRKTIRSSQQLQKENLTKFKNPFIIKKKKKSPESGYREPISAKWRPHMTNPQLTSLSMVKNLDHSGGTSGKETACQCRRCKRCRFDLWVMKSPWRRKWQTTLISCLDNSMERGAWRGVHGRAKR